MKRTALARTSPLRRTDGKDRASIPAPKVKKCTKTKGGCGEPFTAWRPTQAACSPQCAQAMAETKRERAEKRAAAQDRAETRRRKEAMKTRSDWVREAQAAFNAWVRRRDTGKPCICCGRTGNGWTRGGEFDAGHYRSRGSAPHLKFDERNCHAQLKQCNRYDSGNAVGYRKGLIERIGLPTVEALEADQAERKFTIDDLREIRDLYRRRVREMETQ